MLPGPFVCCDEQMRWAGARRHRVRVTPWIVVVVLAVGVGYAAAGVSTALLWSLGVVLLLLLPEISDSVMSFMTRPDPRRRARYSPLYYLSVMAFGLAACLWLPLALAWDVQGARGPARSPAGVLFGLLMIGCGLVVIIAVGVSWRRDRDTRGRPTPPE